MKKKLLIWSSLFLVTLLSFGLISGCATTSSDDNSASTTLGSNIVTGTVTNPGGTNASGVSVYTYVASAGLGRLTTEAAAGTLVQTTTAANGTYSLTGFYPGRSYILIAYSPTYGLTYHPIVTSESEGGTTIANIQLSDNSGGDSGNSAPTVTIAYPASDVTVAESTYTITGTVSDTTITYVIIDVNGSQSNVSVTSGSFSYTVILRNGANTITVRASNAAGTGTATRIITSQAATMAIKATLTWDTATDQDLHVYKFANSQATSSTWHCYYGTRMVSELPTQNLDVDDTSGYGPENIRLQNPSANAIYKIAVAHFSGSTATTNCTLRLSLNEGTNAAAVYTYGPYPLTYVSGAASSAYNPTDPAGRWWRPIDVQVNSSGVASIVTATDAGLTYARAMEIESVSK
ncbi:MAG: hypothetical protein ABIH39_08610 [Candidatus Margulisiibacteriota bacterium]